MLRNITMLNQELIIDNMNHYCRYNLFSVLLLKAKFSMVSLRMIIAGEKGPKRISVTVIEIIREGLTEIQVQSINTCCLFAALG